MTKVPEHGTPIKMEDINLIIEAIVDRQRRFREESLRITIGVVLANIGEGFTPVHCVKGEWEGIKADLESDGDIPKCPNGHVLLQGTGVMLGWVSEPVVEALATNNMPI